MYSCFASLSDKWLNWNHAFNLNEFLTTKGYHSIKLKKTVSTGITTEYAGNYIYENDKLQFFSTPEGTVSPKNVDDYSAGFDYTLTTKTT